MAIIVVYDIFGMMPQAKHVCDRLASQGFRVMMPDLYRGDAWSLDLFSSSDGSIFSNWLGKYDFVKVNSDLETCRNSLVQSGAEKIGTIGFCWGGSIVMQTCSTNERYQAAGAVHPSFISSEMAATVQCPFIFLPTKDDAKAMTGIKEAMDKTQFGATSVYKTFDTMHHGFCMGRGDLNVPEQAAAVTEAIHLLTTFFNDKLAPEAA